mgnify:CR=1 FL=1
MGEGIRIAPSLLSADFARLGEEVRTVIGAGADLIHFDVMDNHYVPNLTVGPLVCQAIKPHATVPIDVHLMVKPVDALVPMFAQAGADIISFHPEASEHVDRTIQLIRSLGVKAGLDPQMIYDVVRVSTGASAAWELRVPRTVLALAVGAFEGDSNNQIEGSSALFHLAGGATQEMTMFERPHNGKDVAARLPGATFRVTGAASTYDGRPPWQ